MTALADIQRKVGVTPDGLWGPNTAAAIDAVIDRAASPATPANDAFTALVIKHLRTEEGVVASAYQDHLGFWTIGVGRLIDKRKGGRLSDPEIDMLLLNDIQRFVSGMADWPAWRRVKDDPVRAVALMSMCFQLGSIGLAKFRNTLAMIAAGNFDGAAENMIASLWAKQTPARAARVATMLRTGKMA